MNLAQRIYRVFNLANLDIALGSVAIAYWLCKMLRVDVHAVYFICLGLTVWNIYILDQLYDVRKKKAVSQRRLFYKKYWKPFLVVFIINAVIAITLFVVNFEPRVLLYALPAFLLSVLYTILNWMLQRSGGAFYLKEVIIALGYTAGVVTIPFAFGIPVNLQSLSAITAIFWLALWNVVCLAYFEAKQNKIERQTALSQWMNKINIKIVAIVCYLLVILCFGIYLTSTPDMYHYLICGAMLIYMALPLAFATFFKKDERYRRFIDQVFLLSAISFLLS